MSTIIEFEALTVEGVLDFVKRGQEEHLHLDFKMLRDASLSSREDRRNLACAISGFANSGGGLIVWGVDARRGPDGIDCAVAVTPIAQVALLLTRLNTLTGEAVEPTVQGVAHRVLETVDGNGFAATYVPESDAGPHMARLGEDRYYKRSGDSFYKMEHYDIADMFGKRHKPRLVVFYRVTRSGIGAAAHLGLRNVGRATARAPFFAFDTSGPLRRSDYGLDGNGNEGLTWLRASNSGLRWAYGGVNLALHPGMEHEVACINQGILPKKEPNESVVVAYAVASEDQPLERGEFVIPLEELR